MNVTPAHSYAGVHFVLDLHEIIDFGSREMLG